ncbi:hypothetical protein AVEN_18258-1 [Araneus ventricosus]|uniref:Uncharacterized protein n=1 Tax=Araneus ventricosus TaxID=182803 RepID=A0A4Y2AJE0_ARAVE|nr:hypothetical protein AVEN_18258-1 [Araneus ventricosus]
MMSGSESIEQMDIVFLHIKWMDVYRWKHSYATAPLEGRKMVFGVGVGDNFINRIWFHCHSSSQFQCLRLHILGHQLHTLSDDSGLVITTG